MRRTLVNLVIFFAFGVFAFGVTAVLTDADEFLITGMWPSDAPIQSDGNAALQVDANNDGANKVEALNGAGSAFFSVTEAGVATLTAPASTSAVLILGATGTEFNSQIRLATADGADNQALFLSPAGAVNNTARGPTLQMEGNEFTSFGLPGDVYLDAGDGDAGSNLGDLFFRADGNTTILKVEGAGRQVLFGGDVPTISTCGTTPSAVTGNDTTGNVTTGTGSPTACTATYGETKTAALQCMCNNRTSAATCRVSASSTTAMTMTVSAACSSCVLDWHCFGPA